MSKPETPQAALPEGVLIRLEADFRRWRNAFGKRVLEVTGDRRPGIGTGRGQSTFQIPVADIKSARNEPLIGGGRLETTTKTGEILPLISYSLTVAAQFSEAARGIEQLAKGEPLLH